ncbi:MAG: hypothetical protein IJ079_03805 [Lachnospiraceae bacterium]|nr:hypothetical protein [Lachnospiraceae bacterium]MBR1567533.1 hypothetical protein [Lachnospiraceae bacterium]MBR1568689.1 hypothetical protein [Lachnospiraceae bacterium]
MKKVIDVSKHQGVIDWNSVKGSGITDAILRVGYGDNVVSQDDGQFERNITECKRLGINVGVYIYSYAMNVSQARSEAEHVLRLLGGRTLDYPVYYDLEDANTTGKLSNGQIEQLAEEFAKTIEAAGYVVGIYANKYWWTTKLTGSVYNKWERWVAQYYSECTYSGSYGMWQYGSDGRVNGINGNVDVNICYKDYPAILSGQKANVVVPPEPSELPDLRGYTGISIASALKQCGYDNSYSYREKLAEQLGIAGYRGTAEQNITMLRKLGAVVQANDELKIGAAVRIASGARDLNTKSTFAKYVYDNTYTVISIKNDTVVFGVGSRITGKVSITNVKLA